MRIKIFAIIFLIAKISYSQSISSISPNTAQSGGVTSSINIVGQGTYWNSGAGIYYVRLIRNIDTIYHNSINYHR